MQWVPISECSSKATSSTDESAGIVITRPFGVNTAISEAKRFIFRVSRKSMALGFGSSSMSLIVRSHSLSSLSSSLSPLLYFQWAANPFSAISSMRRERICTSTQLPSGPITVRCSA